MQVNSKLKILLSLTAIVISTTIIQRGECNPMQNQSEVRLYNDYNLPLEPATLTTMSEYNLSLCIFQTIFVTDKASLPVSNVLESYKFDSKNMSYEFRINPLVRWSDGKQLVSDDIILSIARLEKVSPGFFHAIDALLRHENGKNALGKIDNLTLQVRVNAANTELFKRLAAAVIPIVRTDIVDPVTLKVNSHKVSLGPYVIKESNKEMLSLKKNDLFFKKHANMPEQVLMKPYPNERIHAEELLKENAWPNLILDRVFIDKKPWQALQNAGASFWTRSVDRVMFINPKKSPTESSDAVEIIKWLGSKLQSQPLDIKEFPGIENARSLQPKGFVLFKPLEYPQMATPKFKKEKYSVAITSNQLPKDYIAEHLKNFGFNADYEIVPLNKFNEASESNKFDFTIGTVGAADPDPVTWLSLIIQSSRPIVSDFDGAYAKELTRLKKELADPAVLAEKLREFIYKAGIEGSYAPLAHFSTIAVASKNISFEDIWDTDETIDISRLIMRN